MTKYNSQRLKFKDGRIIAHIPTSKQPDYKTIFPATLPMFKKMCDVADGNLRDEYRRPFWELSVKTKKIGTEEDGSDILEYTVDVVEKRVEPTAAEKEAKRIEKVNKAIEKQMPDMLRRGLTWEQMRAEVDAIDEEIK